MDKNNQKTTLNYNGVQGKDFLQSQAWRRFQESAGRKTFFVEKDAFSVSLIEHNLPIVGKYLYCPRGSVLATSNKGQMTSGMQEIIELAKKENAGWIRIDQENEEGLNLIQENINYKISKAPHDMQPKEIFVIDISKPGEQLLSEMKSKTRYNINLAKKKEVKIMTSSNEQTANGQCVDAFLQLTKEMARRNGIAAHPAEYYRKMIESLPAEMLQLYCAEYKGRIIAANLMLLYGDTATYLHGASSNDYRNVMAPYLLQWQAILDAKEKGYKLYDFGGVKTEITNSKLQIQNSSNSWQGITTFKLGFSPNTKPLEFAGSYDIIINSRKYALYKILQKVKELLVKIQK